MGRSIAPLLQALIGEEAGDVVDFDGGILTLMIIAGHFLVLIFINLLVTAWLALPVLVSILFVVHQEARQLTKGLPLICPVNIFLVEDNILLLIVEQVEQTNFARLCNLIRCMAF